MSEVELPKERVQNGKLFRLDDGSLEYRLKTLPVHRKDSSGMWVDIDMSANEAGEVRGGLFSFELLPGKVGYKGADPNGRRFELELTGVDYKRPIVDTNPERTIYTWTDIELDTDFEVTVWTRGIKVVKVLKTANASKVAVYRSERQPGIMGNLHHLGEDAKGSKTELNVTRSGNLLTQTWTGKVRQLDANRRRTWSEDVAYPVRLDPTSTFVGTTGNDDGQGLKSATFTSVATGNYNGRISFSRTGTAFFRQTKGYVRFPGITIAQSSTINSATLNLHVRAPVASRPLYVWGDTRSNPAAPSKATQITPTTGSRTFAATHNMPTSATGTTNAKAAYSLESVDVKNAVQSRVNAHDYSNAAMLFYVGAQSFTSGTTNKYFDLYFREWGSTKDPELVINFTEPATGRRRVIIS